MKKALACLITVLFLSGMIGMAHADLVERDFLSAGDSLLTYDTESGFEWLDLEITRGMNYYEVEAELVSGGTLEGFSIANASQVEEVFRNGGFTYPLNTNIFNDGIAMDQVKNLISLFGNTITDGRETWLWASWGFITGITGTNPENRNGATLLANMRESDPYCSANIEYGSLSMDYQHDNLGTWLFRVASNPSDDLLVFFEDSVADGTIYGRGKIPSLANFRLWLFKQMLETAKSCIEAEKIDCACRTLNRAQLRCDGEPWPKDFILGEAVPELENMIIELIQTSGCN